MASGGASWATAYTAASPQPPDTDPTAVSSGATSIAAPGCRGADCQVRTTVASPAVAPVSHQRSSSCSTSRTPLPSHRPVDVATTGEVAALDGDDPAAAEIALCAAVPSERGAEGCQMVPADEHRVPGCSAIHRPGQAGWTGREGQQPAGDLGGHVGQ